MQPWVSIGIDPGARGGVFWLAADGTYGGRTVDTKDPFALVEAVRPRVPSERLLVTVERVWGRGGWPANTNFMLGAAFYGAQIGARMLGVTPATLMPARWQARVAGVIDIPRDKDERKAAYRTLAAQLFPTLRFSSGMADAAMIAICAAIEAFQIPFPVIESAE